MTASMMHFSSIMNSSAAPVVHEQALCESWPVNSLRPASLFYSPFVTEKPNRTSNAMKTQAPHAFPSRANCESLSPIHISQEGLMFQTDGGFDVFEVCSSLQKSVRRGDEQGAGYWCFELYPRFSQILWTRLRVIAVEDISVADSQVVILIDSLANHFHALKKPGSQRLCLAAAILSLCRAKKSRVADHLACVIHQRRLQKQWKLEPPDFALDHHTRRGRRMGRGWDFWFSQGTYLENKADVYDPYESEAKVLWLTKVDDPPSRKKRNAKRADTTEDLFDTQEEL